MKNYIYFILVAFYLLTLNANLIASNNQLSYADDRILIKLSFEAEARADLPRGLYEEATTFNINDLDEIMKQVGGQKIIRAHRRVNDKEWEARTGFNRWFIIKLSGKTSVEKSIELFKKSSYIENANLEYYAYPTVVPNDPMYNNNWGHHNTAQLPVYIDGSGHTGSGVGTIGFDSDVDQAWEKGAHYGSSDIVIAIIDTGVDLTHPDLRLVQGYDYGVGDNDVTPEPDNPNYDKDSPPHGTNCAGIAAAITNNSIGVAGVAGGCSIMPLKVTDSLGYIYSTPIVNAITHAVDNGSDVVSLSLGSYRQIGDVPAYDNAIEFAFNNGNGIPIFAATANDDSTVIAYPANHQDVIAVGAASPSGERKSPTSSDGETNWGSNYGVNTPDAANAVDIMGPTILPATDMVGSEGYDTSGDYFLWFNGTSCATPYVAGVAALLLSYKPDLTADEIREALVTTTTDMTIDGGVGWDRYTGYGMVNAFEALVSLFEPVVGDGSVSDPYQIASLENLYWIAHDISRWDKHYIQTADIDASATQDWLSSNGWKVIGNDTFPFTGSYNGNNHTITNLYKSSPGLFEVGLFGCLEGANISNLGMIDVNITGYRFVGGLAGKIGFSSNVTNCYTTGSVNGREGFIGGLTGYATTDCTISNSYSTCTVVYSPSGDSDSEYTGGLVGYAYQSSLNNCYSIGSVSGTLFIGGLTGQMSSSTVTNCYSSGFVSGLGGNSVGGLIGYIVSSSTVTSSYWDIFSSGQTASAGGTGKTTTQMYQQATYSGWDFVTLWQIIENQSYPFFVGTEPPIQYIRPTNLTTIAGDESIYLAWDCSGNPNSYKVYRNGSYLASSAQTNYLDNSVNNGVNYYYYVIAVYTEGESQASNAVWVTPENFVVTAPSVGDGSIGNPYQIASFEDLTWIAQDPLRWALHYIQTSNIDASTTITWDNGGWVPIGNGTTKFTGSYNGNGFQINSIYINRSGAAYQGLFGYTLGADILSLGAANVNIYGSFHTGGLVGYNNSGSVLSGCYSTGQVSGGTYSGGLVGYNNSSSVISNCYSHAVVSGSNVGGLVGYNDNSSSVSKSYSTGFVSGGTYPGGLVGRNVNGSTVISSYWNTQSSGQTTSSGGSGRTTAEMIYPYADNTYLDWDFNTIWLADFNHNFNQGYPYLLGIQEPPDYLLAPIVDITHNNDSIVLSWPEVTGATLYLVFTSDNPSGVFTYHMSTTNNQYIHSMVTLYQPRMFYRVIAYNTARDLINLESLGITQGMNEKEVIRLLQVGQKE